MEEVEATLRTGAWKAEIRRTLFLMTVLLLIEVVLCCCNRIFFIFVWIPSLPLIHLVKRKRFLNTAQFCYGTVVNVVLDDESDVYMYTKVEFIDYCSKEVIQTVIDEHWGDFDEKDLDKIMEFYAGGKARIGKKVPLFYRKENPNKNLVFLDDENDGKYLQAK